MNNDNRDKLGRNEEDRFSTLDIDGINDLYYQNQNAESPTNNKNNRTPNSTPDLLKIVALLASIIILIFVIYTAIVGILGSHISITADGTTTTASAETAVTSSSVTTSTLATSITSALVNVGTSATTSVSITDTALTTQTTSTTFATSTTTTTAVTVNPAYKDVIIFIDAGHGGKDPGSIGELNGTEYHETDINLAIALLVRDELEKKGFTVVMSRETDVFVELEDRGKMAQEAEADMFISLHCNSFSNPDVFGPRMYYTARSGLSYSPVTFATYFAKAFDSVKKLAYPNMNTARVASDESVLGKNKYYAVLCNTDIPSVLIEMGFITNTNDLKMLTSEWWQLHTARAVADAVENAYNAGIGAK